MGRKEGTKEINFVVSEEENELFHTIAESMGCSLAEAGRRAIQLLAMEQNENTMPELRLEIDEVNSAIDVIKRVLNSMLEHIKTSDERAHGKFEQRLKVLEILNQEKIEDRTKIEELEKTLSESKDVIERYENEISELKKEKEFLYQSLGNNSQKIDSLSLEVATIKTSIEHMDSDKSEGKSTSTQ